MRCAPLEAGARAPPSRLRACAAGLPPRCAARGPRPARAWPTARQARRRAAVRTAWSRFSMSSLTALRTFSMRALTFLSSASFWAGVGLRSACGRTGQPHGHPSNRPTARARQGRPRRPRRGLGRVGGRDIAGNGRPGRAKRVSLACRPRTAIIRPLFLIGPQWIVSSNSPPRHPFLVGGTAVLAIAVRPMN